MKRSYDWLKNKLSIAVQPTRFPIIGRTVFVVAATATITAAIEARTADHHPSRSSCILVHVVPPSRTMNDVMPHASSRFYFLVFARPHPLHLICATEIAEMLLLDIVSNLNKFIPSVRKNPFIIL